jgi:phage minor structural protein
MLFILNNKYETVAVMDSNLSDGCPFFNDTHHARLLNGYNTLEFSVPANHPTAGLIEVEGYIIYTNNRDGYELFRVKNITEQHGEDITKTISCEPSATHDLITKRIRPVTFTSQNVETIISQLLTGSGWELGEVLFNGVSTVEFNDYPTSLDAIHTVIAQFDVEIEFKVEFDGTKVRRKIINLYEKRGEETDIVFEYGRNLVGVIREEHTNQLYTAMVGVGKEGISLDGATSSPEKGFEIVGDTLVDTVAVQRWTNDGIHREGLFRDNNAQSKYELYQNTLAELKKYNKPQYTYTVQVAVLEDIIGYDHTSVSIGDQILIKDITFLPEPLFLSARVLEKETSETEPDRGVIVLGEFVEIKVQPIVTVQKLQQKIDLREEEWNQAVIDSEENKESVAEMEKKVTYKVETHSTNGIAFKNGVISTQIYTVVYHGNDDITATLPNSAFIWKKYTKDGVIDSAWTDAHVDIGALIDITGADVYEKATFTCEVDIV